MRHQIRFFAVLFVAFCVALSAFSLPADAARRKSQAYNGPANKYAAIVVDADTGDVLLSDNADKKLHPASLTKMMTLYMVFGAIDSGRWNLYNRLNVSANAASASPTKLGLRAGSTVELEDAILGLVTRSANDASIVLAESYAGSEEKFAALMTSTARQLGMKNTTFRNASGLPDAAQISTARDMAILGRALMFHYPKYFRYFDTTSFVYNGNTYTNHNHLKKRYPGMDGIKTGYTRMSGFNLVSSVRRDGRRIIGVVFGGKTAASRDNQMAALLDQAFAMEGVRTAPEIVTASSTAMPLSASENNDGQQGVVNDGVDSAVIETDRQHIAALTAAAPTPTASSTVIEATPTPAEPVAAGIVAPSMPAQSTSPQSTPPEGMLTDSAPPTNTLRDPRSVTVQETKRSVVNKKATAKSAGGQWGIQIGAYNQKKDGQSALRRAQKSLPLLLADAKPSVTSVKSGKSKLFRARLVGLSRNAADQACKAMRNAGRECVTVQAKS